MRERLLAVDVLAQVERGLGDHGVRMVGRRDDHGVDPIANLVEHPAEVVERLRLGMALGGLAQAVLVNVAEGDDILASQRLEVVGPATAHTHEGDVQLLGQAAASQKRGYAQNAKARGRESASELPACGLHRLVFE